MRIHLNPTTESFLQVCAKGGRIWHIVVMCVHKRRHIIQFYSETTHLYAFV